MTAALQRKRSRPHKVKLEDFLSLDDVHPYGCFPGGNRFIRGEDTDATSIASPAGMTETQWFSDALWQNILGFCNAATLALVVQCSRYLYVAAHQPELWRDLVLRRCDKEKRVIDCTTLGADASDEPIRSWRDFYFSLFVKNVAKVRRHTPMEIPGVYSDEYYRTHRCRSFALPDSWLDTERTAADDTVPYASIDEITAESFLQQFEAFNQPVIVKGAAKSTRAVEKWHDPNYLLQHNTPNKSFRTTSGAAPLSANFILEAYQTYSTLDYLEESPLYLFDRTALDNPRWHDDFFPQFYEACPWWDPSAAYGHDLLKHLGASKRPDHTWLIMGPKRSGSVFHIDPNATHAWNACVQGRKRWIFYPPGTPPPGVFPSADGDEVALPLSVGEWLLQYWPEHLQRYRTSNSEALPMECTVYPGDVVFVPHGWWHMVINLDDQNIAITHNYVSPSNLGNVLRFFDKKQDQISGCRDRAESIKPERLHDAFVDVLARVEPKHLHLAQQQQGWTCRAWKDDDVNDKEKEMEMEKLDKEQPDMKRPRVDEALLNKESNKNLMARTEKVAAFTFSFL